MRACEDDADRPDDVNPDLVTAAAVCLRERGRRAAPNLSRGRMEYQPTKMARRKICNRTAAAAAACLLLLFIHSGMYTYSETRLLGVLGPWPCFWLAEIDLTKSTR